jgi:hypothetical protein
MTSDDSESGSSLTFRDFLASRWRRPGMKFHLIFILALATIVARKGLLNLLVVFAIAVPATIALAYRDYRREVRTSRASR